MIHNEQYAPDTLLEQLVMLADDEQALQPDQLVGLMAAHDVSADVRLMGALCAATTADAAAVDVDAEWHRMQERLEPSAGAPESRLVPMRPWWHWAVACSAAAVLLAVVLWLGRSHSEAEPQQQGYVAYVRQSSPQDIVLTIGHHNGQSGKPVDVINLSEKAGQQSADTDVSESGRMVLDYKKMRAGSVGEIEQNTVTIPRGKEFQIVFGDGTRVWLHAESRLVYPSHFVGAERRVYLEGEAYFDVAKDPRHPFVIQTDKMEARVLGTELNVSSYPGKPGQVALISGRVHVSAQSAPCAVELHPGQVATLADDRFDTQEADMEPYLNWRKGYVYFADTPLVDVVTELGRWYNIDVIIENRMLMDRHVRFFFPRNESVERAVELLNTFHEFNAILTDDRLVIKDL